MHYKLAQVYIRDVMNVFEYGIVSANRFHRTESIYHQTIEPLSTESFSLVVISFTNHDFFQLLHLYVCVSSSFFIVRLLHQVRSLMAEQNSSANLEDESSRHRRERRELQATIQQLKKSVNKNDKARKKKVDGEIKALEEAFAKRWQHFDENTTTESTNTPISNQSDENPPSSEAAPVEVCHY